MVLAGLGGFLDTGGWRGIVSLFDFKGLVLAAGKGMGEQEWSGWDDLGET